MTISNKAHNNDSPPKAGTSSLLEARVDPSIDQPPSPFGERPTKPQERPLIDLADNNYLSTPGSENNGGPPPDFSLYDADYFETDSGDIVSHDSHLNTDGKYVVPYIWGAY